MGVIIPVSFDSCKDIIYENHPFLAHSSHLKMAAMVWRIDKIYKIFRIYSYIGILIDALCRLKCKRKPSLELFSIMKILLKKRENSWLKNQRWIWYRRWVGLGANHIPYPTAKWQRCKVRGADDLFLDHFRLRKEPKQIGLKSQPLVSQPSSNI